MKNCHSGLNFLYNEKIEQTVNSENIMTTHDNRFNGPENINNSAQS